MGSATRRTVSDRSFAALDSSASSRVRARVGSLHSLRFAPNARAQRRRPSPAAEAARRERADRPTGAQATGSEAKLTECHLTDLLRDVPFLSSALSMNRTSTASPSKAGPAAVTANPSSRRALTPIRPIALAGRFPMGVAGADGAMEEGDHAVAVDVGAGLAGHLDAAVVGIIGHQRAASAADAAIAARQPFGRPRHAIRTAPQWHEPCTVRAAFASAIVSPYFRRT